MATARNLTMIPDVENAAYGKSLRADTPRSSHGEWMAPPDRNDPVALITSQNTTRVQWLVPIRHWRMSQSPFAFYRGAAKLMAHDLAQTATTGIETQICGDAHLSNFGAYGAPDRELVFDLNDFDETLPGPWEWDLKRLATSFAIAARHNEYDSKDEPTLAETAAKSYREAMTQFASMRYLDVWYARLTVADIYETFADQLRKKERKSVKKFSRKAMGRDSLQVFEKLAEQVDGRYQIASQPPLLIPLRDWPLGSDPEQVEADVWESFDEYLGTIPDHLQVLLRRFERADVAMKVVGVGSVGTRCMTVLLQGKDAEDPFFLQAKEASRSVLEDHQSASIYENHGQRVVVGQRLMQAASDSFLGWTMGSMSGAHYYWRQLRDMKASPDVESASLEKMYRFARICGWVLARAHARSGVSQSVAGYLGKSEVFDRAMGAFAVAYADQNERDYSAFRSAIRSGAIEAHE